VTHSERYVTLKRRRVFFSLILVIFGLAAIQPIMGTSTQSYTLQVKAASLPVFRTDFENVTVLDANHLNLGIANYFEFGGSGGASMWMEGLDRTTPGITCHSGSRCVGMELTDITKSRRAEFNIHNLQNLVGNELFVSVWLYLPADWRMHIEDGWWELADPSFAGSPTYAPYSTVSIDQPHTVNPYWNLRVAGRDINQQPVQRGWLSDYALPRGQWFNLQYYVLRDQTNGIVRVWIGGTLLFNINNAALANPNITEWFTTPAKIYYDLTDTFSPYRIWVDGLEIYNTQPQISSSTSSSTTSSTTTSSTSTSSSTTTSSTITTTSNSTSYLVVKRRR